jgi:tetratricopeptide (TPR) repeat protein
VKEGRCDVTATVRGWRRRRVALAGLAVAVLLPGCASLSIQLQQQHEAQVAFDEGVQRYNAREYAAALPSFRHALALRQAFDEAEAYLAWTEYYLAKYPEAALHFRQVIARQPRWEGLYDGLGWTRYREGRYHIALQAFQQALDLAPSYRDAAIGSSFSLFELGRYREAGPRLEQLLQEGRATTSRKSAPDLEEVRSRYAWSLFYLGEYERARVEFATGLAVHPEWYGLHNGMGWSQLQLGDRVGARASFERALRLRPDYADAKEGLDEAGR